MGVLVKMLVVYQLLDENLVVWWLSVNFFFCRFIVVISNFRLLAVVTYNNVGLSSVGINDFEVDTGVFGMVFELFFV